MKPKKQNLVCHEPKDSRICFSKSIIGCFCSVSVYDDYYKQPYRKYLYRTKNRVLYKNPYSVADSKLTGEVWRTEDTEVIKVGCFSKDWLLAIPCTYRGSQHEDAKKDQRKDIIAIDRIFDKAKIPFSFIRNKKCLYKFNYLNSLIENCSVGI
ncbi:MAG: hypothetical protein RBR68_14290 [Tenuifilaceae bacterium]|nr:hypothetical protein [Tenuifilaceae bacterium]